MDEADYGNRFAELFRQQALRDHFRRSGQTQREAQKRDPDVPGFGTNGDVSGPRLCLDCGEEIGEARMKANPAATRCVSCQEKKERNHGR